MAGRGQQQYVVVTKQRKKSGCIGGMFHLFVGLFTFGLWPAMVWISHLIGPKRKEVSTVYAPAIPAQDPYGQPQVRHYIPPGSQPWNQPTAPAPQPPPRATQPPYRVPPPVQQQPPDDPWSSGQMRRRS